MRETGVRNSVFNAYFFRISIIKMFFVMIFLEKIQIIKNIERLFNSTRNLPEKTFGSFTINQQFCAPKIDYYVEIIFARIVFPVAEYETNGKSHQIVERFC